MYGGGAEQTKDNRWLLVGGDEERRIGRPRKIGRYCIERDTRRVWLMV